MAMTDEEIRVARAKVIEMRQARHAAEQERMTCHCVRTERPQCGRSDCWHFGHNGSDCDLCHKTGRVR